MPRSHEAGVAVDSTGSGGGVESTVQLVERARAGDQHALDRLFARFFKPLRRWASGRLPRWGRDLTDTDDLVQVTLVQAFKRIEALDLSRVGALQAYLRQAVLNRIRSELRRAGRQPDVGNLNDRVEDGARSPLEQAIGGEIVERYETALAALRPEEQEAIIGRVEMGYTYPELADALGKPSADAARKAAERALLRLAEEMGRAEGG
jgi:RNA polymerase sigma-70 factor (ECF subfamily)